MINIIKVKGLNRYLFTMTFLFLMLSVIFGQVSAVSEEVNVTLARKIDRFTMKDQSLAEAVNLLAYVYKVRICLEEIEYTPDDASIVTKENGKRSFVINKKNISVDLSNATVKDILNALTMQDNNYFWEVSPSGLINILPQSDTANKYEKSVLNWNVSKLVITGERLVKVSGSYNPFGRSLLEHGIGSAWLLSGNIDNPELLSNRPIHVDITNGSARECLNAIVKSAGTNCFWILYGYKRLVKTPTGPSEIRDISFGLF